jgi:hypothetical protein
MYNRFCWNEEKKQQILQERGEETTIDSDGVRRRNLQQILTGRGEETYNIFCRSEEKKH